MPSDKENFRYIKKPHTDTEIFSILHPYLAKWFDTKFKSFSPPQKYGILPIHRKEHTLISAPTGTGKTLTVFTSIINQLTKKACDHRLEERVYCVYISPLKALSRDIERNLLEPLSEIETFARKDGKEIGIRVFTRTGDTKTSEKNKMLKKPPHILITTPESFAIILTSKKFKEHLKNVEWLIVDEIHSIADNKRGAYLSLSIERLNNISSFTRIGLSATVSPLEEVAKYLVGQENGSFHPCNIVDVQFPKDIEIELVSPVKDVMESTQKEMNEGVYELLNNLISQHESTLIFTNTRAGTERVVYNLKSKFPEIYTEDETEQETKNLIGAHHGSLSVSHRLKMENLLKQGKLKAIVSSTSLELGIDIGYVDLVIMLGSAKSVSRTLQRLGRSGHSIDKISKGKIIVMDRDSMVECAVLLKLTIEKNIDNLTVPKNSLDVLAQQIYGMSIEKVQTLAEIYNTVKRSYCYNSLSKKEFDDVISYLKGDYTQLESLHVYPKIWVDEETGNVGKRGKLARMIYMTNIGTIPDESYVTVKVGNEVIGKIDEGFLEKLKRGDVFVLGGETYKYMFSRGMVATVVFSSGTSPNIPSWIAESLPMSYELALSIQKFRRLMEEKISFEHTKESVILFIKEYLYVNYNIANQIYSYFYNQYCYGKIAHDRKIVLEHFKDDIKKHTVFHSVYGRKVNEIFASSLAHIIKERKDIDVSVTVNDNCFMLSYYSKIQIVRFFKLLNKENVTGIMDKYIENKDVLRRRFRQVAARSMMIIKNYKGRRNSVGRQQVYSMLLYKAVMQLPKKFPMMKEAKTEVLENFMDIQQAKKLLDEIEQGTIKIEENFLDFPSPFSFNIAVQGYADIFHPEDRVRFLQNMQRNVNEKIKKPNLKLEFSYDEIWKLNQEAKEREKIHEKQNLKKFIYTIQIPKNIIPLIEAIIEGEELEQTEIDILKEYRKNLKTHKTLYNTIKLYINQHDEKEILLKQLAFAANEVKLDTEIVKECQQIIMGKRKYISRKVKIWINEFVNGTVPYVWKKEIVRFLMKIDAEINNEEITSTEV